MKTKKMTPSPKGVLWTVFCLFFLITPLLSAQDEMKIKHGCNFASGETGATLYTYDPSNEATQIIERIMTVNALSPNFIIKAADCKNALATTDGKERYILYNTTFLENFKNEANTQWAAYCVLAHEIGHHLNNHDLAETNPAKRKKFELEADKFAGGVMRKLGANLEQAQAGINTFSLEGESQTHPAKNARLNAIAVGWKQVDESLSTETEKGSVVTKNAPEMATLKAAEAEKDALKALDILDDLINEKPFAEAFFVRAEKKMELGKYQAAVEDLTEAIQNKKNYIDAFIRRSQAHFLINKEKEAFSDANKAIQINPRYAEAYLQRAWLWRNVENDYEKCFKDCDKAIECNPNSSDAYFDKAHAQYAIGEYPKAIENFTKTLELNPKDSSALQIRAYAKKELKQYKEAIADLDLLEKMQGIYFDNQFNRAVCRQFLGQHKEAIKDFDKVLLRDADVRDAYIYRGVSKLILGQNKDAETDFNTVIDRKNRYFPYIEIQKVGCLLVEYNKSKEGIKWLDEALNHKPELEKAKECKAEALKKM